MNNRPQEKILLWLMLFAFMACTVHAQPSGADGDLQSYLVAPADPVDFSRKFDLANQMIEQQKWAEAETILAKLSSEYPLHGTVWVRLAYAYRKQAKHEQSIRAYEKVVSIQGPAVPYNARYWIAVAQSALGQTKAALDTLETMVFTDAYLQRPELVEDANFASLKDNPRFLAIAGKEDVSRLSRIEGWRRDLDYMGEELKRSNPSGSPIPEEFFRLQRELKTAVPQLNDFEIVAGMGRMLHALGRGHTALWLGMPGAKVDFRPMPIRLYAFPEGLFIIEASKGHEALAGAQVLAFGNTPADEALRKVSSARSTESPMEDLWVAPLMLTFPSVLAGLGMAQKSDVADLKLKMPDGSTITKSLGVIEMTQPNLKLNPPPGVPAPMFLRNLKDVHWMEPLPEHDAIYVQVNNIMPDKDETLPQFGFSLRKRIDELKPRNIILDIRHNNGGNTFTYMELLRTLIAFSAGEGHTVYALIGRNVYSAAGNFTSDLEQYVRAVFVGEPTSQMGNQWGDESQFVLPYSGITGAFSGIKWQHSHPWDKRHSIVPQVPVQLTAKDYFAGQDPALNAVFRIIQESKPKQ